MSHADLLRELIRRCRARREEALRPLRLRKGDPTTKRKCRAEAAAWEVVIGELVGWLREVSP